MFEILTTSSNDVFSKIIHQSSKRSNVLLRSNISISKDCQHRFTSIKKFQTTDQSYCILDNAHHYIGIKQDKDKGQ